MTFFRQLLFGTLLSVGGRPTVVPIWQWVHSIWLEPPKITQKVGDFQEKGQNFYEKEKWLECRPFGSNNKSVLLGGSSTRKLTIGSPPSFEFCHSFWNHWRARILSSTFMSFFYTLCFGFSFCRKWKLSKAYLSSKYSNLFMSQGEKSKSSPFLMPQWNKMLNIIIYRWR